VVRRTVNFKNPTIVGQSLAPKNAKCPCLECSDVDAMQSETRLVSFTAVGVFIPVRPGCEGPSVESRPSKRAAPLRLRFVAQAGPGPETSARTGKSVGSTSRGRSRRLAVPTPCQHVSKLLLRDGRGCICLGQVPAPAA
jgi:hypothetical protein